MGRRAELIAQNVHTPRRLGQPLGLNTDLRKPSGMDCIIHMNILKTLVLLSVAAVGTSASAHAQTCDVTLRDANVWTGSGFAKQTLAMRDGRFVIPDATKSSVNASYLFLIPPFADGHSHKYDSTTKSDDPAHNQAIAQGARAAPRAVR